MSTMDSVQELILVSNTGLSGVIPYEYDGLSPRVYTDTAFVYKMNFFKLALSLHFYIISIIALRNI